MQAKLTRKKPTSNPEGRIKFVEFKNSGSWHKIAARDCFFGREVEGSEFCALTHHLSPSPPLPLLPLITSSAQQNEAPVYPKPKKLNIPKVMVIKDYTGSTVLEERKIVCKKNFLLKEP